MTSKSPNLVPGHGIQVLKRDSNHAFSLDEKALSELLLREDICDCPVVVLSVAGPVRKGKSTLLNFFLRYLNHKYNLKQSDNEWLGDEDTPLTGFDWRCGYKSHTSGIWLWSQPFIATLENNKKVAILLMDTQGIFDGQTTLKNNSIVFALSMLLSSVQIYNLSRVILEDDLQYLQFIMEYGRQAQQKRIEITEPYQHLQFIVRDWSWSYEHSYGSEGGEELLKKILQVYEGQHQELQTTRRQIKESCEKLTCFLMPRPGSKMVDPKFKGELSDLDKEFKMSLEQLVPLLLAPHNLKPKLIDGKQMTARELLQYFKSYMRVFNGTGLPEPKTILQVTAEVTNLLVVAKAREVYHKHSTEMYNACKPYLEPKILQEVHCQAKELALHTFNNSMKMGGAALENQYRKRLEKEMVQPIRLQTAARVLVHNGDSKKNV